MKKPKIKEINNGIASRVEGVVYLNKRLRKYPKLRKALIAHELEHSSGYNLKDLEMDVFNEHIKDHKRDYYAFVLSNPSSWTEFLPINKVGKTILINPSACLLWILGIFIFIIAIGIMS